MINNPATILAINPGTRYIGIAVLEGTDLSDWGVKVASGKWSDEKLERIRKTVSTLIEYYQPDILAIKKPHPSRSSAHLDELIQEIIHLAERRRVKIRQYSLADLECLCEDRRKITREAIAEMVCWQHPVLLRELRKEQKHSNPYYVRMLEAVALGMLATAGTNHRPVKAKKVCTKIN